MKSINALQTKIQVENEKLRKLEAEFSDKISLKLKEIEFISCRHCKSRMDTRFRKHTLKCPICNGSFLSDSDLKKKQTIVSKIEALKANLKTKVEKNSKVLDKDAIVRAVKSTSTFRDYLRGNVSSIDFIDARACGVGEVEFQFSADKNDGILYDGRLWAVAGFHYVNRVAYLITKKEWTNETEQYLDE